MEQSFKTLKRLISCEVDTYRELLKLSKKKKAVLVNNNTSELKDIVKKEQILLSKIKEYEQDREHCVLVIADAYGIDHEQADLNAFIELKQGESQDFINLRKELKMIIEEISTLNDLNKSLIETHMKYVAFCVETVAGRINDLRPYAPGGQEGKQSTGHLLVDQTI